MIWILLPVLGATGSKIGYMFEHLHKCKSIESNFEDGGLPGQRFHEVCSVWIYINTYYAFVMNNKPDIEFHIVFTLQLLSKRGFGQDTTTTSVPAQIHEQYQVEESLINVDTIYTISESWIHSP